MAFPSDPFIGCWLGKSPKAKDQTQREEREGHEAGAKFFLFVIFAHFVVIIPARRDNQNIRHLQNRKVFGEGAEHNTRGRVCSTERGNLPIYYEK